MLRYLFLPIVLLPAVAMAQSAPIAATAPPPPKFGPEQPYPTAPHSCQEFYPPGPFLDDVQGKTLMAFTVNPDGHVAGPVVKTSSGNADLDDAASRCVLRWTYRPAMKDGVAVAAPWMANVVWQINHSLKLVSFSHCSLPPQARTQPPGAKTVISYVVNTDGVTSYIDLKQSDADSALDKAASACIASWRFEPRKNADGEPVDAHVSTTVIWTPPN